MRHNIYSLQKALIKLYALLLQNQQWLLILSLTQQQTLTYNSPLMLLMVSDRHWLAVFVY